MSENKTDIEVIDFSNLPNRERSSGGSASRPARTSGGSAPRRKKKISKKQRVLNMIGRVCATILLTLLLLVVWLWGVMKILVDGPSKTARDQFVMSVSETSGIWWLANLYCSKDEIAAIKAANSLENSSEITNSDLVQIDTSKQDDPGVEPIEIIDVKGGTYNGKLMMIKDPSRLFVGKIEQFHEGTGEVVADIAKRYDAIAGINGGEFVDGSPIYTGMPVGLVMINGEVLNGDSSTQYHVTGITNDNKLVIGNMSANQAKEKNIRDCVSIAYDIGPFLVINGEPQNVSGVGGGLNPRTAIGQTKDGTILFLVIDGRQVNSIGASFSDLQDIMLQYGAVNASTMDGGTSSQLYYDGEVISVPYSPSGPRRCPTAFLIKK